ncbi:MAG: Eco57I restriction-modification methylase domain-containing protein [Acidimicrobiales bacterium]
MTWSQPELPIVEDALSTQHPSLVLPGVTQVWLDRHVGPGGTDKLRGGYYTPEPIAEALASWAVRQPTAKVLEPSAGDGIFVTAVVRRLGARGRVDAQELFGEEAGRIRLRRAPNVSVTVGDAFTLHRGADDGAYDAVVGNPPFIRYQSWPEQYRTRAFDVMHEAGLSPNRLTNAWVPFVVLATRALRPGGRLAMVLPAELLSVSYAAELRNYLARSFETLWIVTFRKLTFELVQQETLLVMGVKGSGPARIALVELDGVQDLTSWRPAAAPPARVELEHGREKWTQYYLTKKELGLVRAIESSSSFPALGTLARVNVGIVTGQNAFFVMSPTQANAWRMRRKCLRIVSRTAQLPGLQLTPAEWERLVDADQRCLLLQLGPEDRERLSEDALAYVEHGERLGYHRGFKCRIREPTWWNVPSTQVPDGFMLRQVHEGPKVLVNRAGATCTDTVHRVFARPGTDVAQLAAASMNSVTFAFAEIRGRSYGGGVLELEPTEAEGLPIPCHDTELPLDELDLWARRKEPEQVLAEVDRMVLLECGLSTRDIELVKGIWRKLCERRLHRKHRSR